jgi:hypothetical protein
VGGGGGNGVLLWGLLYIVMLDKVMLDKLVANVAQRSEDAKFRWVVATKVVVGAVVAVSRNKTVAVVFHLGGLSCVQESAGIVDSSCIICMIVLASMLCEH